MMETTYFFIVWDKMGWSWGYTGGTDDVLAFSSQEAAEERIAQVFQDPKILRAKIVKVEKTAVKEIHNTKN